MIDEVRYRPRIVLLLVQVRIKTGSNYNNSPGKSIVVQRSVPPWRNGGICRGDGSEHDVRQLLLLSALNDQKYGKAVTVTDRGSSR
jgi:hypothetical protein